MTLPIIDYLGEGRSDEAVATRLITAAGALPGTSFRRPTSGAGKPSLDRRLNGLNAGVEYGRPVLVLRDLDHDASCPIELRDRLLPNRHPRCLLRICVREVEAWLMADRAEYARTCGLAIGAVPTQPEQVGDLKALILGWVAASRATKLKRHMEDRRSRAVPDWAALGEWHARFAEDAWDPARAVAGGAAPSLERALSRLRTMIGAAS